MDLIEISNLVLQLIVATSAFFVMQTKHVDDSVYSRAICAISFLFFSASILISPTNVANLLFTVGSSIWFIFNIVLYDYFDIFGLKAQNISNHKKMKKH